jgi:cell division protein FtsI/penicillin-binding protein 2
MRGHILSLAVTGLCLVVAPAQASQLGARTSLRSYLEALVVNQRGSAIVIDPATGEIQAAWNLQAAVENAYPPGSAAKIVEATAALEEGLVAPGARIMCQEVPPLLGSAYRCAHPQSPEGFTLASALANSCNYFFTAVSLRLSLDSLLHWYSVFGFGSAATLDGRPTASGCLRLGPGARSKALAALGEKDVMATAAQLLEAYCLVANHGTAWGLWTDRAQPRSLKPLRRINLRSATYGTLVQGFVDCVQSGTCQAAVVPGVEVAGKTGTATALDGSGATHAWFVGFAPVEHPEIALVVFLERGTGAQNAAPLAGKLLRRYFAMRGR